MDKEKATLIKEIGLLRDQNEKLLKKVRIANLYKQSAYELFSIAKFVQGSYNVRLSQQAKEAVENFKTIYSKKNQIINQ